MSVKCGDRVQRAEFKVATKSEVVRGRGGWLWRTFTLPWDLACKVCGTYMFMRKSSNALNWNEPLIQQWGNRVATWLGYQRTDDLSVWQINSFRGNRHLINESPAVAKAFFKHHRNDELFDNSFSMNALLNVIREIFSEEEFSEEDFMMTCTRDSTTWYHSILGKHLAGRNLEKFFPSLSELIKNELGQWEKEARINVTVKTRIFSSRVIFELMFGGDYDPSRVAVAVDFINSFIIRSLLGQATKEDKKEYVSAKVIFKDAVEAILRREDLPIFEDQTMTNAQKKALIFLIFFAGQETTAALLSYMIWRLALDPDLQEQIREDNSVVDAFFNRAIKEFPPAYGVGRKLKNDVCLEYELEDEVRQKIFLKGELVVIRIAEIAKQSSAFEFMPFGGGPHRCPGQKLAEKEIKEFLLTLVSKHKISTEVEENEKIGFITTKLADDVIIRIENIKIYQNECI